MKLIACIFAVLLATAGVSGARADDKNTDGAVSETGLCKPLPRQRRLINLEFKLNSLLIDVAGAYTAMACKRLKVPGDLSAHKVTLDKQKRLSLEEVSALVRAQVEKAGLGWVEDDNSVALVPGSR